jgi:DNA-binding MarR family transcriptional regulator
MSKDLDHQKLNDLLHSRIRFAIMVALATVDEIDFLTLLNEVNTTKGNLSVHLTKLEEAKYVEITKKFVGKKPLTLCKITTAGSEALDDYLNMIEQFAKIAKSK